MATLKIIVVDENDRPVAGAIVKVNSQVGTTNARGEVVFDVTEGIHTVSVDHWKYKPIREKLKAPGTYKLKTVSILL